MEKNFERSAKVFGYMQEIGDGPVYPSALRSMLNFMLNVVELYLGKACTTGGKVFYPDIPMHT
jgi:hypothetical protein